MLGQAVNAEGCSCASIFKNIETNRAFIKRNKLKSDIFKQGLQDQLKKEEETIQGSNTEANTTYIGQNQSIRQNIISSIHSLDNQYKGMYEYEVSMIDLCALKHALIKDNIISDSSKTVVNIRSNTMSVNSLRLNNEQYLRYISLLKKQDFLGRTPTNKDYEITFQW